MACSIASPPISWSRPEEPLIAYRDVPPDRA
jgi:hypothetical protein